MRRNLRNFWKRKDFSAKSDNIIQLSRFRNKSEPTWMFISNGKMVNLMFGVNVPQLTRVVIDEIRKENMSISGQKAREFMMEITDLTAEEQALLDAEEERKQRALEKEALKKAKELFERRTAECQSILSSISPLGVVLIFPNARTKYQEVFADLIQEAGVMISQTEKVHVTKEKLDELLYFCNEDELDEGSIEILLSQESLFLLMKPEHGKDIENITDTILTIIYGPSKQQPGSEDSAAQLLFETVVNEETGDVSELRGVWAPPNHNVRAVAIKLFFTKFVLDFLIPEPGPIPDYLAVVFDFIKFRDAIEVMNQYPKEIMQYGFFTHEIPEQAQVVAKSIKKLEKCERTFKEKLVMQVSKKKSECILAFVQLGPTYISPNAQEGKRECEIFFPDDYVEEEEEEEEEDEEVADETTQTTVTPLGAAVAVQEEETPAVQEEVAEVVAEGEEVAEGERVDVATEPLPEAEA